MKKLITAAILLTVGGCATYTPVGNIKEGMSYSEVRSTTGTMAQTGVNAGGREYRAWLKSEDDSQVEPYLLTFDAEGNLTAIRKDTETIIEDKGDIWNRPSRRTIPPRRRPDYRYQW